MRRIVLFSFLLCVSAGMLCARNIARLDTVRNHLVIPRPALEPLKSLVKSASDPIDTLSTANEYIKVVLFADNTWQYVKLPGYKAEKDVFEKNWDTTVSNPYKIEQSDLPYSWSIWLVDSLDQYKCPFQGDIHPRGKFGPRRGRRHQGVDIPLKTGDPIYAAFTGKVRMSKYLGGYGNVVVIRHENGIETFHGHLSKRMVEEAEMMGADAIVNVRYTSSAVMQGAAEVIAYGTAVKFVNK